MRNPHLSNGERRIAAKGSLAVSGRLRSGICRDGELMFSYIQRRDGQAGARPLPNGQAVTCRKRSITIWLRKLTAAHCAPRRRLSRASSHRASRRIRRGGCCPGPTGDLNLHGTSVSRQHPGGAARVDAEGAGEGPRFAPAKRADGQSAAHPPMLPTAPEKIAGIRRRRTWHQSRPLTAAGTLSAPVNVRRRRRQQLSDAGLSIAAGNRGLADPPLLISSLVVRQGVYTDGMSLSIRNVGSRNA